MLFAVPALTAVGLIWSLTGVVMSDAPRKNCDTGLLLMVNAFLTSVISLVLCLFLNKLSVSTGTLLFTGGCYFAGAALNFVMLQIMSYSMQRGPNGVIWSIIQSALIFPFLCGVIFFGNELNIWRAAGLILILAALACLGGSRENVEKSKGWKLPALAAFLMTGVILSINNLPSYFPESRELSSMGKTLFSCTGSLFASLCWTACRFRSFRKLDIKAELKRPVLWKYVFFLGMFGLISAYLLFYPGMDAMAKAGAGCISYPLMVGACIVGFNLYSLFIMKEKWSWLQLTGVLFCIVGEVLLSDISRLF